MSDDQSPAVSNNGIQDDSDVAFAAEFAAGALEAADVANSQCQQHQQPQEQEKYNNHHYLQEHEEAQPQEESPDQPEAICRICGKKDDGRPILRFRPAQQHETRSGLTGPNAMALNQDVFLHVFCGKTASILPNVNQPEWEILSKAGLKNKHGIGAEVNAALARTRCAVLNQPGAKEKQFYLVREFEANLAAVKNIRGSAHVAAVGAPAHHHSAADPFPAPPLPPHYHDMPQLDANSNHHYDIQHADPHHHSYLDMHTGALASPPPPAAAGIPVPDPYRSHQTTTKVPPHKASAGQIQKSYRVQIPESTLYPASSYTPDGNIRCACGGTHPPNGLRGHVMTKRHRKWLEEQGAATAI